MKGGGQMRYKKGARIFGIIFFIVVLCSVVLCGAGRVIYVPDDYAKIQWAVNNASAGDTIIIRDGVYTENIHIYKDKLTLRSENGSENCIIKSENYSRSNFYIAADYVNISGFTVMGSLTDWWINGSAYPFPYWLSGFYMPRARYCNISNNIILYSSDAIEIEHKSSNNVIKNNIIKFAFENGIELDPGSEDNIIENNTISDTEIQIFIYNSPNNTLVNNSMQNAVSFYPLINPYNFTYRIGCSFGVFSFMHDHYIQNIDSSNKVNGRPIYYWINEKDKEVPIDAGYVGLIDSENIRVRNLTFVNNSEGVLLVNTTNSSITSINASYCYFGVRMYLSSGNNITGIRACKCVYGIALINSSSNSIYLNNLSKNTYVTPHIGSWKSKASGLLLYNASNNYIYFNNISGNRWFGIHLIRSHSNWIYLNNFMNNSRSHVYSKKSLNYWSSPTPLVYTYKNQTFRNYLGNYWDDYNGDDSNGDGIGDTPYIIDGKNVDYFPLMEPFENYIIHYIPL